MLKTLQRRWNVELTLLSCCCSWDQDQDQDQDGGSGDLRTSSLTDSRALLLTLANTNASSGRQEEAITGLHDGDSKVDRKFSTGFPGSDT